jgi:predicted SprT family Zn-dependent metalloprotease
MQQQIEQIRAKVQQCIRQAEQKFGITMPHVEVRFDLTGRAAGMAGMVRRFSGDQFYLRFNTKHMALGGKTFEHLLNDTVPHEVAHTVCQAFPRMGKNHDAGWKRVCIALGGNGQRCYTEEDAPEAVAAQRPYVYITTTGHECRVTKVIHTKIQRGTTYTMKGGKGKLTRECQYNYMTAPAVAQAKKPVVVNTDTIKLGTKTVEVPMKKPAVPAPTTASKAELIRAMIRNGWTEEQVVARAVSDLGMTRQLAKTYYKNNVGKV